MLLAEKLFNEGLVLQKSKTKILPAAQYIETTHLLGPTNEGSTEVNHSEEQKLLNISVRFDPYSPTAEEDYERLKAAVSEVDILGILGREVGKTTIDMAVTRHAINSIRVLDSGARYGAIQTLLEPTNLDVLAPVFPIVMRTVRSVFSDLPADGKQFVNEALVRIYEGHPHLLSVELNLSYFLLALSPEVTRRKEEILIEIYENCSSPLLKRQIILIMAKWATHFWLADIKQKYGGLGEWEKRAFILASYVLGDEGKHWRKHTAKTWTPMDDLVRSWFCGRFRGPESIPL